MIEPRREGLRLPFELPLVRAGSAADGDHNLVRRFRLHAEGMTGISVTKRTAERRMPIDGAHSGIPHPHKGKFAAVEFRPKIGHTAHG